MNSLTESRKSWREPSVVKEITSPTNQVKCEKRRDIERHLDERLVQAEGDDYYNQLFKEVA